MFHCTRRFVFLSAKRNVGHFGTKFSSAAIPSQLLELLVCPLSKDQLVLKDQSLQSQAAGIAYPIIYENGIAIINMIPRDATLLLQEHENA